MNNDYLQQVELSNTTHLLGAEIRNMSGPVKPFWINLEPGIALIYGKNGTGKTHLLKRIAEAGRDRRSYLHFQCTPPKDVSDSTNIWYVFSPIFQEEQVGFHEDMHNFLEQTERWRFFERVHEVFVRFLIRELKQDGGLKSDEIVQILEIHLEERSIPFSKDRPTPRYLRLPHPLDQYSELIQLLAYRSEIWIHDDEAFFEGIIHSLALEVVNNHHFVISKGRLFVRAEMSGSIFGALLESLDPPYQDWEYIDLVETFGRLGDSLCDWRDEIMFFQNPWKGLLLDTDIREPSWGRVIADVDLDLKQYAIQTNSDFVEDLIKYLYPIRYRLEESDPRYLGFLGDPNYSALLIEDLTGARWDDETLNLLNDCSKSANLLFHRLIDSDIELECLPTPISSWGKTPPITWQARTVNDDVVPLGALSWAEQRWASFAIRLSTPSVGPSAQLLIIDEPERGLHRRAEKRLSLALWHLMKELSLTCVMATHSPTFLTLKGARLHHLWRYPDGESQLDPLPDDIELWTEELGLEKHDLLQLCKLFLIVEGEHDAVVLNRLFKDEFTAAGVWAIPLRGLRNLKNATDASFIFRFTEASVLYLSDNEDSNRISLLWDEALRAAPEERIAILDRLTKVSKSDEAQFLKEFMVRASNFSSKDRILFKALPAKDILDYLPVSKFVPENKSWPELRKEWQKGGQGSFKVWLSTKFGSDFSNESIEDAVDSMDSIPKDLTDLLFEILKVVR